MYLCTLVVFGIVLFSENPFSSATPVKRDYSTDGHDVDIAESIMNMNTLDGRSALKLIKLRHKRSLKPKDENEVLLRRDQLSESGRESMIWPPFRPGRELMDLEGQLTSRRKTSVDDGPLIRPDRELKTGLNKELMLSRETGAGDRPPVRSGREMRSGNELISRRETSNKERPH